MKHVVLVVSPEAECGGRIAVILGGSGCTVEPHFEVAGLIKGNL